LTSDFWAENAENNCKYNKQKQIPFGDDNQKGNCKSRSLRDDNKSRDDGKDNRKDNVRTTQGQRKGSARATARAKAKMREFFPFDKLRVRMARVWGGVIGWSG
jgi:hypothetical protein